MSDAGSPLTMDDFMQLQQLQRKQAIAQQLLGGQSGQQNAAFGGLANVGSMLAGAALAQKNNTDQQNLLNQMRYNAQPDNMQNMGQAVGAGGKSFDIGAINAKTPLIQSKTPGLFDNLSNIFSFGGAS
jgi:hypothetical protein